MAISPPSDIVMDVLRAADPQVAETARARLQKIGETAQASTPFPAISGIRDATPATARSLEAAPYQKFEALVLGSFIQSMLPEEAGEVYGGGYAGDMWKSMLAQQLGESVAARGGIGIANRLLADRYQDGDRTVALAGATDGAVRAKGNEQEALSTALVQEMQRKMAQSLAEDASVGAGATKN